MFDLKRRRRKRRAGEEFSFRPKKNKFNKHKFFRELRSWLLVTLIAAVCGYAFVTFCFQTVTVIGPSMRDTLVDGQVVLVNKMAYRIHDVERYDIIAYSMVENDSYYDIKRVIGLPGETLQIIDGYVYIDGSRLSNLPVEQVILSCGIANSPIVLGDNEYFVLGDNVNNSEDSRYTNIGNVTNAEILGRVDRIVSPKSDRERFE